MKRALVVLAVLLAFSGRSESGDPGPTPLWLAYAAGSVSVAARSTCGAECAELAVANLTSHELVLEVNGALVAPVKPDAPPRTKEKPDQKPSFDQTQPLGVGLIAEKSGDTRVRLAPGASMRVPVLTVCLNSGVPAPDSSTPLALMKEPTPHAARKVLEKWQKNPKMDQSSIQSEVWSSAPPLAVSVPASSVAAPVDGPLQTVERAPEKTPLPENTIKVAIVKGEIAVLTSSGELSLAAPNQGLHVVATEVSGFATDMAALHVLTAKSPLSGKPAIVRLDVAKKQWTKDEFLVSGSALLWARSDAAILERDGSVFLVDGGGERRLVASHGATLVETQRGAVVLAPGEGDGETRVVRVERARRCRIDRSHVNAQVVSACAVGDVVYATDDAGTLLELRSDGERPLRVGDLLGGAVKNGQNVTRIAPGSRGLLLVETPGHVFLQRSGAPGLEIPGLPDVTFLRDTATGDLYSLSDRSLRRWDDRSWIDVRVDGR
jgi:hypothetical protein